MEQERANQMYNGESVDMQNKNKKIISIRKNENRLRVDYSIDNFQ